MDLWLISIVIYSLVAFISAIPVMVAMTKGVKLHDGGDTFQK